MAGTLPQRRSRGFSIGELMVVMLVIAALAASLLPGYMRYVYRARRTEAMVALRAIHDAQVVYAHEHRRFADSFELLGVPIDSSTLRDDGAYYTYTLTTSQALGFASVAPEGSVEGDVRRAVDTVGIFVDAGGIDTYGPDGVPPTSTDNDATWTGQGDITVATERGVGVDQTGVTGL